ncbi:MAG: hypothetical protein RLY31_142 [Bacteroidota bacterium]
MPTQLSRPQRSRVILTLGLLTTIGPFSIDLYLPAFRQIAEALETDLNRVALSLSSFFIGLAAGQLFYGPLLERYGRKRPLYVGMAIYLVATLGCMWVETVEQLIVLRFFQALGSCAGLVASRAIVRDLFEGKDIARVFSLLIIILAVSPILAPTAGGYIAAWFGWRFVFLALAFLCALILAAAIWFLPESKEPDPSVSLRVGPVAAGYRLLFREPVFLHYALLGGVAGAGLYSYLSGASQLYLTVFRLSEQQFGLFFALIAAGLISASQLNAYLLRRYSSVRLIEWAAAGQSVFAAGWLLAGWFGWYHLAGNTILLFGFLFFLGFLLPNSSALAMGPVGRMAGNASAMMGALQMAIATLASAAVSLLNQLEWPAMPFVMAACAALTVSHLRWGRPLAMAGQAGDAS